MNAPLPGPLIAQGRTAEVYVWREGQILKLFYGWCPHHWAEEESKIGRLVTVKGLPTPGLIETVEVNGRQGIVYERVIGPTMLWLTNAKPWQLFRLARQLAELHAEVHGHEIEGLPDLRASLEATIRDVESLSPGEKRAVLRLLEALPSGNTLCHFDFHPDQVLVTTEGPVVIDWMTAHRGAPLADVARTSIILTVGQVPGAGWAMRTIVNLWRRLFLRSYVNHYLELHPGAAREDLERWMVPVAAARLQEQIPEEETALLAFVRSSLRAQSGGV